MPRSFELELIVVSHSSIPGSSGVEENFRLDLRVGVKGFGSVPSLLERCDDLVVTEDSRFSSVGSLGGVVDCNGGVSAARRWFSASNRVSNSRRAVGEMVYRRRSFSGNVSTS